LDILQSYRGAARLQNIDFESQVHSADMKDGIDFKAGLAAYNALKVRLFESFNDFSDQEHKIIQVVLSDHTMVISPENVHDVLRLEPGAMR
jgi:hypothetical protein